MLKPTIIRLILLIWVSPNTLIGLLFGTLGLMTGGHVQIKRNCLEFYGGWITALLRRIPPFGVAAVTFGHTIIGQDQRILADARDHEQVHVRQYERWGPMFLPAYLGISVWLMLRRRDFYRENPFEIDAYSVSDPKDGGNIADV